MQEERAIPFGFEQSGLALEQTAAGFKNLESGDGRGVGTQQQQMHRARCDNAFQVGLPASLLQ